MTIRIALDAGHGINTAGKRTPDGEREWSFNNTVLLAVVKELNVYSGVSILRLDDPSGKTDVPLTTRTRKANEWKADALVSIHHNAMTGRWGSHGGVETFVHPTARRSSFDLANAINPRIVNAMGLRNRGVKTLNLHMTRESNMTAILTEGGFMDSTTDIGALRSNAKLDAQGKAIADGIAAYYKLSRKTGQTSNPVNKPTPSPKPSVKPADKPVATTPAPAGKPSGSLGLVDWMKAQKMDSSYKNRSRLYGKGYKGTASQNSALLATLQGANKPASKPVPVAKPAPSSGRALRYGDSGEEVREMQRLLARSYFYPERGAKNHGIDGHFGRKTEDALKRFQSVYTPHEVDGMYGPKTKAALRRR